MALTPRERQALDDHITGHGGEDQFPAEEPEAPDEGEKMPTREDDLLAEVRRVEALRRAVETDVLYLRSLQEQFNKQHAPTIRSIVELKATLESREKILKALAVMHFERTGKTNKKPAPGVSIVAKTLYQYDAEEAKKWAVEHGHGGVLKLDTSAFEKVAKSALRPEFVTVEDGYAATLAKDLTAALAAAQKESSDAGSSE